MASPIRYGAVRAFLAASLVTAAATACGHPPGSPSSGSAPPAVTSHAPSGVATPEAAVHTIVINLELTDPGAWATDPTSDCTGKGGYEDVGDGMQFTIRDQDNRILGVAEFGMGLEYTRDVCTFTTAVVDIPDADFYVIETNQRGTLTYSWEEMEASDWNVYMEIGD